MIAIGYRAAADTLPAALLEREVAARVRKELETIAFGAGWDERLFLVE